MREWNKLPLDTEPPTQKSPRLVRKQTGFAFSCAPPSGIAVAPQPSNPN